MGEIDFPDSIAPAITAYYFIPAVWCGSAPSDKEWELSPEIDLIRNIFEKYICEKIRVRVRRDGLFVFDFSKWSNASETEIPGYSIKPGNKIPKNVTKAERDAEEKVHYRNLILNVHQACISTANHKVHSRSSGLGQLITSSRMISFSSFEYNGDNHFNLGNDPFQRYLTIQTTLSLPFRIDHPEIRRRNILELDTISYSFSLLEEILNSNFKDLPLLIEMLFRAAIQFSENHFADCLILCWTVCERLLNEKWDMYLSKKAVEINGESRINQERRKKLLGRDFTASIIMEALELANDLPTHLFKELDFIRKARNNSLHNLSSTTDSEAAKALRSSEKFLHLVTGINITLSLSRVMPGTGTIPKHLFTNQRQENS